MSSNEAEIDADLHSRVLSAAYQHYEAAPQGEWECSVRLASSVEIAALHGQFFGDPTDTDVMSFPSGDALESNGGYLGDIAISIDMARTQAREARHSLDREIAYLALHGMLHLLGHDDLREADREAMLSLQDTLLAAVEREIGRRL